MVVGNFLLPTTIITNPYRGSREESVEMRGRDDVTIGPVITFLRMGRGETMPMVRLRCESL